MLRKLPYTGKIAFQDTFSRSRKVLLATYKSKSIFKF